MPGNGNRTLLVVVLVIVSTTLNLQRSKIHLAKVVDGRDDYFDDSRSRGEGDSRDRRGGGDGDRSRPWMVVHVGPPKTGTSTIQGGLIDNSPALAGLDNVFYVGQRGRVVVRKEYRDRDGGGTKTFSIWPGREFVRVNSRQFSLSLEEHRRQNHNVVISSEHFNKIKPEHFNKIEPNEDKPFNINDLSNRIFLQRGNGGKEGRRDRSMKKPKNAVNPLGSDDYEDDEYSGWGFDVKIAVTYRHYFQWLPSFYYQELINHFLRTGGAPTLINYTETILRGLGDEYLVDDGNAQVGEEYWLRTIPPDLERFHGSLFSYRLWSTHPSLEDRVEVFDVHQQRIAANPDGGNRTESDLVRDFVCQVLPSASRTCSRLERGGERRDVRVRNTDGRASSLDTGELTDTEALQLLSEARAQMPDVAAGEEAGKSKMDIAAPRFDATFDRADSVFSGEFRRTTRLRENFRAWARRRGDANAPDDGHRRLCLGKESSRALGVVSWKFLRHVEALVRRRTRGAVPGPDVLRAPTAGQAGDPLLLSPGRHDSRRRPSDEVRWAHIRRAHDALFEEGVERGDYCELDVERLFADEDFVREVFFKRP